MSDEPEPLSAILAEMREFCSGWSEDVDVTVKVGLIYGWACRLKEAAEREARAADRFFGNVASMRDALRKISLALWIEIDPKCNDDCCAPKRELARLADAAIAVPTRNCDLYPDCNSAWKAYNAIADRERLPGFDFWLFEKAKEGGARHV